jgi:valacyclovir hydrolase
MAWFEHSGDTRIWYEESGAGDPLLIVNGWSGTIDDLLPLRDVLSSTYRVIAADAPGSGKSQPQPRTYTPGYNEADARAFLAMLKALDATPAHLVGFSDGGESGLLIAAIEPAAARSVVSWGAAGSLGTDTTLADMFYTLISDPIPELRDYSEYMKAAYGEENARIMSESAGTTFRTIIERGGDISRSRAADITCPALLITGENDIFDPPELVSAMAEALPNGEFLVAPGSGHAVHHDCFDWLVDTMTKWLAAH